ncbi:hypothetical protein FRC14_002750 [Serendipita sp. 396]|nr:hypothetical protein FRC14_002750 [Serendipita sp. 396]
MIAITLISLLLSSLSLRARAEDHQILVGGAIAIFEPNNVTVVEGDTVTFTFINGTHSVLQSNFVFPCEFINEAEPTSNGFNSGARPANNGTSVTNLTVQITGKMGWANTTTWFYDGADKSCGWDDTAAGGFNLREDSNETLAGYLRNGKHRYLWPDSPMDDLFQLRDFSAKKLKIKLARPVKLAPQDHLRHFLPIPVLWD